MTDVVDAVFETVAATVADVRSALPERRTYEATENPSGERQLAADAYADELLCERLGALDGVGCYASEERADPLDVGSGVSVAVDPLDGSSNLRPNNVMGTIVGIFDAPLPAAGSDLLAAGFVLYGPTTTMVVARDGTATEYLVVDGDRQVLTEDLTLPDEPTVYGFGGRVPDWPTNFASFVDYVESDRRLKLRYGGAMVGDVNQVLTYGGVFGYPALTDAPTGKLRLQFEGIPIAAIVEAAGGRSSDGERSLLDVEPTALHQRVPVHVGNDDLVEALESHLG